MLINLYHVDLGQPENGEMLKKYIEMYLFYNFIRILELYALFLHLDSGLKVR
jgi:hypothetical protein